MKKFLPIIIGVVVGLAGTAVMIQHGHERVAYSLNWWDEVVAAGQSFNWNDVFSAASEGEDLYTLVHNKLLVYPERDALREVGKNNGLTIEETDAVVGGSITPLFNKPGERISQEDALGMMNQIREDYEILKEVYELQQEIDIAVNSSEIFANNDLSDSGFDLIYDLSVIEEILFVEIIPNTVGENFGGGLSSPILPTEGSQDFVVQRDIISPEVLTGSLTGDFEVESEILPNDVCTEDPALMEALADYEADEALLPTPFEDLQDSGVINEAGEVNPAPADNWLTEWCESIGDLEDGEASGNSFGQSGFSSLGDVLNSTINQSAGALAATVNENFAAHVALCLETNVVSETVSSYQPGDSCVACEIESINETLDKTLSHSLIPNKVTGNLLESTKCKAAYDIPLVDMKFITIAAPVPAPPNDDLINNKNIFEEWKKFTDRYQPLLLSEITFNQMLERQNNILPSGTSQQEVINNVQRDILKYQAEARQEIENGPVAESGSNTVLYAQTVGTELALMTEFFEGYLDQYEEIAGVCRDISQKQYIQ